MVCQNPYVKFYKGTKSEKEFKVTFQKFEYLPNFIAEKIRKEHDNKV